MPESTRRYLLRPVEPYLPLPELESIRLLRQIFRLLSESARTCPWYEPVQTIPLPSGRFGHVTPRPTRFRQLGPHPGRLERIFIRITLSFIHRRAQSAFSLASTSGWEFSPTGSAPLTRDRIVRLGSARVIPSWSLGSGSGSGSGLGLGSGSGSGSGSGLGLGSGSGSAEVEMWEWTSDGSEWQGRESRGDENETQYEDALSQFHFPTLEESRWAYRAAGVGIDVGTGIGTGAVEKGGTGTVERNGWMVAHPALGEYDQQQQRTVRFPFRFILETVLGIDPATLNLLERGTHEPESISDTAIFGTATDAGITDEDMEAIERSERMVWPSFSLLCVWAAAGLGLPSSKWRVGQR
ncbi:voltage-dependent ion-selective channel protein [Rhizoctonia solani]|uniref:Voltage-dependent ion-selective channel protein n=1 Tax=Rhizoctonia solani TaxID=456999 RepID=A0A8H8SVQ6_9AGAM|nr:voltage-dependent ion-selective channel protein [Rhizoctonia solani]QRW20216.1 voltage-dependent ion-selective channel protein [Rhizoctonia solani]